MSERRGILVVDDTPAALKLLTEILVAEGYPVRPANSGELALSSVKAAPPELILLDIRMPGLDGFEVCRRLKANPTSHDIPVIFISAIGALQDRVEGFALGAVDFISKPYQREELLARVRTHLELDRLRNKLESRVEERTAQLMEANEDLMRSEEKYRELVETLQEGIWVIDENANTKFVNPRMAEMLGYTVEEMIGQHLFSFLDPTQTTATQERLDRRRQGIREKHDTRLARKDGAAIYVSMATTPLYDRTGSYIGDTAAVADITERKRAEEEREKLLKELKKVNRELVASGFAVQEQAGIAQRRASELEAIIWSITDAIFVCDREGLLVEVNAAGLRLICLKDKPEKPTRLVDLLSPLELKRLDGKPIVDHQELALWRALHGETVRDLEEIARAVRITGDIHLLVSAVPIYDKENNITGAVEIMSDITRLRELDLLKDQFVAVAAHELKTPVTIMKGYAQILLQTSGDLTAARRRTLEAIDRGANRIDKTVKELLDISMLYGNSLELRKERFDLREIVQQVVNKMEVGAPNHSFELLAPQQVVVIGDRDRIEQVLHSLLDNAVRYSPKGGRIEISLRLNEGSAVVSVKDNGVGIPAGKQRAIFQRFYRAHTHTPYDYGGMGVGLYLSNEIVSRHGGHMWFESEEGVGSTFHFCLPLTAENQ